MGHLDGDKARRSRWHEWYLTFTYPSDGVHSPTHTPTTSLTQADDKLALSVRDKLVKTFPSVELAKGILGLYLGKLSPTHPPTYPPTHPSAHSSTHPPTRLPTHPPIHPPR